MMEEKFKEMIRQSFRLPDNDDPVDWETLYLLNNELTCIQIGACLYDMLPTEHVQDSEEIRPDRSIDVDLLLALLSGSCLKDGSDNGGGYSYSERVSFSEDFLGSLNDKQFSIISDVLSGFKEHILKTHPDIDLELLESAIARARLGVLQE